MAKTSLSPKDQTVVDSFNAKYGPGMDALERSKQLQIGDYLILHVWDHNNKKALQTNSYGAPIKYKVVHAQQHGIPFIKRVNKKGDPIGPLYSVMGMLDTDDYIRRGQRFEFELDPDFADSLLLQDKYDPATLHRSKKDIWKAVTEHNKACKVPTDQLADVILFFNTLNVGDIFWISNVSHYIVHDKNALDSKELSKNRVKGYPTRVKGPFVTVLTVADKNGKVIKISHDYFHGKALYRERPRSYRELNI